MESDLFGGGSGAEEEEDSSEEESSGEDDLKKKAKPGNAQSSSSDSGSDESDLPAGHHASPEAKPNEEEGSSQFPNTQDLFGESSSDDNSEGEDGSPKAPIASPLNSPVIKDSPKDEHGSPEASPDERGSPEASPDERGSPEASPDERGSPGTSPDGRGSPGTSPGGRGSPGTSPDGRGTPVENGAERHSHTVEGIFGDAADISSSDEDLPEAKLETSESDPRPEGEADLMPEPESRTEPVPRINVEIPRCVASLGSELYFSKLPNFLSVETRPFDPSLYEDEVEEDDVLDEEGRARLKLKVENTIRWRYSQDESGNEIRESNARIVRWSDGSMSLYLGSEIFDIYKQPLQGEYSHLFVRQGTGLQGQAVFKTKLTFRPHSTDSQTHRKMTLSIADRFSKTQKIRVLPAVGKDPESQRSEKIKKEEEKLRAAIRRENQQRRVRERHAQRGLTASYLEPDRLSEGEEEESVAAIKSSVRSRLTIGDYESDGGSSETEGAERLMRAKVEEETAAASLPRKRKQGEMEGKKKQKAGRKLMLSSSSSSEGEESD